MFKLSHKKLLLAFVVFISIFFVACAGDSTGIISNKVLKTKYVTSHTYSFNGKKVIDGGVTYPIVDGYVGPYALNKKVSSLKYNKGRKPTSAEIKVWDQDVRYNGIFPEGHGSVKKGKAIYQQRCIACHGKLGRGKKGVGDYPALAKGDAYKLHKTLFTQHPVKVFGSYWPYPSSLLWYIKVAMPHAHSKILSWNQSYALVAYILKLNNLRVDGELIGEDFKLNQDNFGKIEMPNLHGFVPDVRGVEGVEKVRYYMNKPRNYGARTLNDDGRCMHECLKKVKIRTFGK